MERQDDLDWSLALRSLACGKEKPQPSQLHLGVHCLQDEGPSFPCSCTAYSMLYPVGLSPAMGAITFLPQAILIPRLEVFRANLAGKYAICSVAESLLEVRLQKHLQFCEHVCIP